MYDPLGDRLKAIEHPTTSGRIGPDRTIYARLDGRAFSTFTRDMHPFDERMTKTMHAVTKALVEEFNATIGYVQSDEISLIWKAVEPPLEHPFGGSVVKLTSLLPSFAASVFAQHGLTQFGADRIWKYHPHFDCRVLDVNAHDATDMILWRADDAHRNAVSAEAQTLSNDLHRISTDKLIVGVIGRNRYDEMNMYFKHGAFFRRVRREIEMPENVRMAIPDKYRPPAGHRYVRKFVDVLPAFDFRMITNRHAFVFENADPKGPPS